MALNELGKRVQQWAADEGIFREVLVDDANAFNLRLEHPAGYKTVQVIQPKGHEDTIVIVSGLNFDAPLPAKLAAMKKAERTTFLLGIRDALMFGPVTFQFMPNMDLPERVQFTRVMYADGITKHAFMDALSDMHQSFVYVFWHLRERFGGATDSGASPSAYA